MTLITKFQKDVDLYLHLRQMQLDAQEDDEMSLAASIGKSMREIAKQHNLLKFYQAVEEEV
ncbi:hypothetical protein [uncultured Acinetobacter sp.]|uniref:hypothetical protein n=1 Tax=uncultured Acinetobacter sp. TaxID=165433 RepID=UPI00258E89D5|nr:hypothetical protein [uncultured Acinetobacter sp.]